MKLKNQPKESAYVKFILPRTLLPYKNATRSNKALVTDTEKYLLVQIDSTFCYRGLAKVKVQVALIFSCLNLKKLAKKTKVRLRIFRGGLCLKSEGFFVCLLSATRQKSLISNVAYRELRSGKDNNPISYSLAQIIACRPVRDNKKIPRRSLEHRGGKFFTTG